MMVRRPRLDVELPAYDKFAATIDVEELYKAMQSFLKCPRCGGLWCFWEGFAKPPTEYVPAG